MRASSDRRALLLQLRQLLTKSGLTPQEIDAVFNELAAALSDGAFANPEQRDGWARKLARTMAGARADRDDTPGAIASREDQYHSIILAFAVGIAGNAAWEALKAMIDALGPYFARSHKYMPGSTPLRAAVPGKAASDKNALHRPASSSECSNSLSSELRSRIAAHRKRNSHAVTSIAIELPTEAIEALSWGAEEHGCPESIFLLALLDLIAAHPELEH